MVMFGAVAFHWEGARPQGGLASVESLRADQAPPVYTEQQAVAAWWEHAYAEPSGGNAVSTPSALLPQPERAVIAGLSQFESGPQPTPTPSPTSEAVVTVATVGPPHEAPPYTVEQWRPLVASIFPAESVDTMLRIIACESGGDPNATGASGERGLAQVHPLHADSSYDPETNVRAAYRISGGGTDWSAWTCAR